MWRTQSTKARARADAAARTEGVFTFLLDATSHRSDSQVNSLDFMHLYPATQTRGLGLNSPLSETLEQDRIYYGCASIPFGGGDFLIVHGVAYNSRFTNNVCYCTHSFSCLVFVSRATRYNSGMAKLTGLHRLNQHTWAESGTAETSSAALRC